MCFFPKETAENIEEGQLPVDELKTLTGPKPKRTFNKCLSIKYLPVVCTNHSSYRQVKYYYF